MAIKSVKIVLKARGYDLRNTLVAATSLHAIAELLREGHSIVLVHDVDVPHVDTSQENACCESTTSPHQFFECSGRLIALACNLNRKLTGMLGSIGIPAFGLCGTDAGMVRVRRCSSNVPNSGTLYDIAQLDASWLDVIAGNGGIPIIANAVLGPDGDYHALNADRLASTCAVSWKADTLIFLIASEGVHDSDGSVMRWLDLENVDRIIKSRIDQSISSSLIASREALNNGIHRVRFFPLDQVHNLPLFYFTRIEAGTEVISSSGKLVLDSTTTAESHLANAV